MLSVLTLFLVIAAIKHGAWHFTPSSFFEEKSESGAISQK
jgi:hypothetical protein